MLPNFEKQAEFSLKLRIDSSESHAIGTQQIKELNMHK